MYCYGYILIGNGSSQEDTFSSCRFFYNISTAPITYYLSGSQPEHRGSSSGSLSRDASVASRFIPFWFKWNRVTKDIIWMGSSRSWFLAMGDKLDGWSRTGVDLLLLGLEIAGVGIRKPDLVVITPSLLALKRKKWKGKKSESTRARMPKEA